MLAAPAAVAASCASMLLDAFVSVPYRWIPWWKSDISMGSKQRDRSNGAQTGKRKLGESLWSPGRQEDPQG